MPRRWTMAKFRKVDPRIWNDEGVQALPPLDKLVAIYCLTGQCNRIGIFKFSIALAAEDLGLPADDIRERLDRVCHTLSWGYDAVRRVLYFPNWWKYNNPGSPKTLQGLLDDVHEVPKTELLQEFASNTEHLSDSLCHTLSLFFGKGMPYQEQEQEQEIGYPSDTCDELSSPPLDSPTPSEHTFPVKASKGRTARTWNLPQHELDAYTAVYGHEACLRELARARRWLETNPAKRKTAGGMLAFLTRWLNKAANSTPQPASGSTPAKSVLRSVEEINAERTW